MKRITIMLVGMIFLAMVMAMGCATGRNIKALDNNIQKMAKIVEENKGDIKKIKANFGLETTTVTAAVEEPETPLTPEAEKALIVKKLKAPAPPSALVLVKRLTKAKAKVPKMTLDNRVEQLELWAKELTHRTTTIEKSVNAHDRKFSDLQRRIAEAEDRTKPLYLWTQPFPTRSSKVTGKNEKKLDDLALELLKGTIKVEKKVKGHADPRGKEKDNEELSKARAQSCIDRLLKKFGPDGYVTWEPNTKWKEYFVAVAGGETDRYGNYKYNRRVRFERKK